jgi:hypothetical protein
MDSNGEQPGPNLLPIEDFLKDLPVGCSACGQPAPFTLGDFERGQVMTGWQLRLIAAEVVFDGEPGRSWRWDLFCPACAGELNPRPPDSLRIRIGVAQ